MQAPFADPLSGLELPSKILPLVGREAEMQAVRSLLNTVALNKPTGARALTISGEMGVGKSRLLAEVYLEARARGFHVLEGRTYESGSMFPYLPFIEALRPQLFQSRFATLEDVRRYVGLEDSLDQRQVGTSIDDRRDAINRVPTISLTGTPLVTALARLFPELPRILQVTIEPEVLSPDQEKFRLFDAIATLLERMSLEQPVLLGIDNLQWADSGSLELTMYLTVRLHSSHIALVGVTRPPSTLNEHTSIDDRVVTMSANIAAARALGDLMRQGLLLLLPLSPLDTEAATQHLHALLPGKFSQELAQSLLSRAEGNPFFLEELIRTLTMNGLLVLNDGVWRVTRPINTKMPESITLAVGQRLQALSQGCRELLRVASLFGRAFALTALVQVLQKPEDQVQLLIDEAVQAAVIAKMPDTTQDVYRNGVDDASSLATTLMFCQGIVQEVLSAEVPSHRARTLHGAIGAALEANYTDEPPAYAAQLAQHYILGGNKEAALRWSLIAGEDATRQQAHREAVSHFRLVLNLLETGVQAPPGQLVPSPAQLQILIGESWFKLGELEQALNTFQQALQQLQYVGVPLANTLGGVGRQVSTDERSLLLARVNRLIADIYRMQGNYNQALAHLQAARTAFDAVSNAGEEAEVAITEITDVLWFPGRSFSVGSSLADIQKMMSGGRERMSAPLDIALRSGGQSISTTERILFLQAQATLDMLLGRTQEAETALWQSHQLATEIGDRGGQAFALQLVGWLCGWGERIHEAIRFQEQAHELYVAIGDPFRAALVDQVLGIVYQALGEMEHARLCTLRGFERARRYGAQRILGLLHWNHGVMALTQGDWTSSDLRLQQALQEAETNNDARLKPLVLQAQAALQFRRGNWIEAKQLFRASIQAAATTEWLAGAVALYGHFLAVTGQRKSAQEQLDRAAAYSEPSGLAGHFYIPFLAEGYIHLGANERATTYIERIRSMRGLMYYGTSVDRILGVVATLAGDWETAEQAFEDGLTLCRRANNEPEEATILYEQARATLQRVGAQSIPPPPSNAMSATLPGGQVTLDIRSLLPTTQQMTQLRERLRRFCERARELFLRYQMQRAADLVDTLQEGVQQLEQQDATARVSRDPIYRVPRSSYVGSARHTLPTPLRLTSRELEVLSLVAEGHTDREVADTLVISPRTVNRHLSNIFVKLDVPGRAAAVAYAVRQGIV